MPTNIEWTSDTLNITTGCEPISSGCQNCYARVMHKRLRAMGQPKYQHPFETLHLHPEVLGNVYSWKKPRLVFVNSMSDLFHAAVPEDFIKEAFRVFQDNPCHNFQVLTKRSERMLEFSKKHKIPSNVWLGVTVEEEEHTTRISSLIKTFATVRFVSFEPLLGRIPKGLLKQIICGPGAFTDQPYNKKIQWLIVGGETGHGARQMDLSWAREIRDFCQENGVPFFFKKIGGSSKWKKSRRLDGRKWEEWPQRKQGGQCG